MFDYSEHGGYGYYSEREAESNLKYKSDCTERGTYRWFTCKDPERWVEVTSVYDRHQDAPKDSRFVAAVLRWVDG